MKKYIYFLSLVLVSSLFLYSCQIKSPNLNLDILKDSDSITTVPNVSPTQTIETLNDQINVQINTKYGPVVVELFQDLAPNTIANFLAKVQSGFYNGLSFHRVVSGFVVQGGDPLGNGTGGGEIKSEINNLPFKRSSLGLARGMDKNISNDSQFFICLTDEQCGHLTNEYVNFGQVISGMEYVDQIKQGDLIIDIVPLTK